MILQRRLVLSAPDVDRDTIFRFKLVVKDGNGGQAADSINILTRNVAVQEPASLVTPSPKQEEQQNQGPTPSSESGSNTNQGPSSTENHSPMAEAQQTLSTDEGKQLAIILKGNDPDKDDEISFVILTNPSHGTIAGFDKTSGSLIYLPTSGFIGQDRLTFKVIDSHEAESNVGVVHIVVCS